MASTSPLFALALISLFVASASAATNLTQILDNGRQYTTFIRLLGQTQATDQIKIQLNNSRDGLTIFAPTDNAFNSLKAGTLNGLSTQQQVELIQFHIVPKFYDFESIKTASNPIRTQAGGTDGFSFDVSSSSVSNQFNISTGVNSVSVTTPLNVTSPLAVYSVDKVLLPSGIFGPKAPEPAPAPPGSPKVGLGKKAPSPATADTPNTPSAGVREMSLGWASIGSIGLMTIAVAVL